MQRFEVTTRQRSQMVEITSRVQEIVSASGVRQGIVTVYVPHTTAGITINENADPDVVRDILAALEKTYPVRGDYRHGEGNAHAHIKASLMGSSCTVIISGGRLLLGTWQGVFFCEFDGPRNREFYVKILEG